MRLQRTFHTQSASSQQHPMIPGGGGNCPALPLFADAHVLQDADSLYINALHKTIDFYYRLYEAPVAPRQEDTPKFHIVSSQVLVCMRSQLRYLCFYCIKNEMCGLKARTHYKKIGRTFSSKEFSYDFRIACTQLSTANSEGTNAQIFLLWEQNEPFLLNVYHF